MSPVSRPRKRKKNRNGTRAGTRSLRPMVTNGFDPSGGCDCPACTGNGFDPQQLIDELTAGAADLVAAGDPLAAETMGAVFVSMRDIVGAGFDDALSVGILPALQDQATPEALALVLAIGSVTEGLVAKAAATVADRLREMGVPAPPWAAELAEPVTLTDCWRFVDPSGTASILVCSFKRGERTHAIMLSVDHLDCGAASHLALLDEDELPDALEMIQTEGHQHGVALAPEAPDPAELRWQVERALDARAVHDDELGVFDTDRPAEDKELGEYRPLAVLLRARMRALPAPSRPRATHGAGPEDLSPVGMLARYLEPNANGAGGRTILGQAVRQGLPAKRKKSDGPAPVYRIKVGLRGAKPPIWRRLEVPADISLARLHDVIQTAFGWYDSHLHVFETPYGEFGDPDTELGHRAEAPVTLEQVAPSTKSKIRYTYDFGDDWDHDILVEKVLDHDGSVAYPRCTGGRRAAPPEDSGGIWGYDDLIQTLADPSHPEHTDMLQWLGLTTAAEFDPAGFDTTTVNQALTRLR